eukprot:CAMPEP_0171609096 /NCGR_PEP_ID=MMETSP0990-20121206/9289_1 /TAXON_ID=483369 /ORGANISM="non described non described, Strain CCMP2098" /LENGTH=51 /DNA_ID=CAMNT_0012172327 /DNA_START=164 /DNA_END=316 /DNA_ORIENTATION=+
MSTRRPPPTQAQRTCSRSSRTPTGPPRWTREEGGPRGAWTEGRKTAHADYC